MVYNKWFKFSIWAILYLLWVVWYGNYWYLPGLLVVFDIYVTKKVKWAFWKKHYKKGEKRNTLLEWVDALVFALIVTTFIKAFFFEAYMIPTPSMERSLMTGDYLFVSKLKYGPRVGQTPISFPLVHNTLPVIQGESYLEWIKRPYRRMAGLTKVKRDDIVVFNFPNGDTVLRQAPQKDYHDLVRIQGKSYVEETYGPIVVRPDDKKDHYVKRCVAVAGDTLLVADGTVYVNGIRQPFYAGVQNSYTVITNGTPINSRVIERMGQSRLYYDPDLPGYPYFPLNDEEVADIESMNNVLEVRMNIEYYNDRSFESLMSIFPYSPDYQWSRDNYGPLWIPEKGSKVELTVENLPLYTRIITAYEKKSIEVKDSVIYINGLPSDSYTFEMDYYFMMGDNRHNSLDSRYWGFVPESHVVGSPFVVWFSRNTDESFPKNIRWKRIFKFV